MSKSMLIDASYEEETQIVVLEDGKIQEFDFESISGRNAAHNIYLGRIDRVEPGLEAAFVDFGANRHGFLPFRLVYRGYYRQYEDSDGDTLQDISQATPQNGFIPPRNVHEIHDSDVKFLARTLSEFMDYQTDFPQLKTSELDLGKPEHSQDGSKRNNRKKRSPKTKKADVPRIEEELKNGQFVIVQVTKEEINEKGAALTTFISLPGRYCVWLPFSGKGCEISKKITSNKTRHKLESVYKSLDVPSDGGIIMRSVLSNPDSTKIETDFNSLLSQWQNIQKKALHGKNPNLLHEEGNIIERSIRDLNPDSFDQIIVDGSEGYNIARDSVMTMMPECISRIEKHTGYQPLFVHKGIEVELRKLYQPRVELKSGGHIVIEQTEALVSIDVNSAKASKGGTVEQTAVQTNLEAAEEIARQIRLRDLAGIIVIDFIDMNEPKHNFEVKESLKKALIRDRAKNSVESISNLGLLEMTRQRFRSGISGSETYKCASCLGTGRIIKDDSLSLTFLRHIESVCSRRNSGFVHASVPVNVTNYILNECRSIIDRLQKKYKCHIVIEGSDLYPQDYIIKLYIHQGGRLVHTAYSSGLQNEQRPRNINGNEIKHETDRSQRQRISQQADNNEIDSHESVAHLGSDTQKSTSTFTRSRSDTRGSRRSRASNKSKTQDAQDGTGKADKKFNEQSISSPRMAVCTKVQDDNDDVFTSTKDASHKGSASNRKGTNNRSRKDLPDPVTSDSLQNHPVKDLLEFQMFVK